MLLSPFALLAAVSAAQNPARVPVIVFTGAPLVTIADPFVSPLAATELSGNRALIIDQKDNRLALVDFGKNSVTTVGRHGSGPLEYRVPFGIAPRPGGGAIVTDIANRRALLVSPDGTITGTGYTRVDVGIAGPGQLRGVDRAGTFYFFGVKPGIAGQDSLPIIAWRPADKHADTLAWWAQVKTSLGAPHKQPDGVTTMAMIQAYFPMRTNWLALPSGGVAVIHPDPYRIEIIDARRNRHLGPIVTRLRVPIDAAERAALEKDRGGRMEGLPPAYPPFAGIDDAYATPDGAIWVERSRRVNDSVTVYDVFDRTGTLSAQATLRPNSHVVGFGAHSVYVVRQTTSDDFWYLEQWARP
jgi:hypothetical protein